MRPNNDKKTAAWAGRGRGGAEPLSWSLRQVVGEGQEMSSEMLTGISACIQPFSSGQVAQLTRILSQYCKVVGSISAQDKSQPMNA